MAAPEAISPGAANRPHPKADEARKRAATVLARQPARPRLAPQIVVKNGLPAARVAAAVGPVARAYRSGDWQRADPDSARPAPGRRELDGAPALA
jgi:hypothetical protein